MRFYRISFKSEVNGNIIGVDPGITTSGVCFCDREKGEWGWRSFDHKESRPLSQPFGILHFIAVRSTSLQLKGIIPSIEGSHLVVETGVMQGQFSAGLALEVQQIVAWGIREKVGMITLVPPVIPNFFLKKRKLGIAETRGYVRKHLPNISSRIPVHACDAILIVASIEGNNLPFINKSEMRVPTPDIVSVRDEMNLIYNDSAAPKILGERFKI